MAMATTPVRTRPEACRKRWPQAAVVHRLQCLAAAVAVFAVCPAAAQTVHIEPSVTGSLTWTDNIDAAAQNGGSGWVMDVAPGLSIWREGGRIRGRLDASVRHQATLSGDKGSSTYLTLQGRGALEAVENLLFIDVDGAISRDNRSLFSGRIRGDTLNNDDDQEVRRFGVAPRLALRVGDMAASLGYRARWLDSGGDLGRQRVGQWLANVDHSKAFNMFGWALNYGRTDTAYGRDGVADVSDEQLRGILYFNASRQWRLALVAGHESNDYAVSRGDSGSITGAGFDWRPNERTIVSAISEKRLFGRGYEFLFKHRRALSAWTVGWSRDISSALQVYDRLLDVPGFGSRYQGLLSDELDPVVRDRLERELQALGVSRAALDEAVVSNSYFVDRRFHAGLSLIGARNLLSLTVSRSDRERLGETGFVSAQDDFSIYQRIREKSARIGLTHRLSGTSALTATLTRVNAWGEGSNAASIRRTLFSLGWSARLSPRTTAGLMYRYQQASGSDDFTENAITANIAMRF